MTEKDEKNTPQENSSVPDDDLDSLSEDEKAAFEKILAEINAGDQQKEDDAETGPTPPSDGADTPDDEGLSDDQQAALDKIMAEINARDQKQEDNAETEPAPPSDGADTPDDEELSGDQQAALDKIMAEINARDQKQEGNAETGPAPPSDVADTPDDEGLSDDQQAALDKIMAEINAKDQKQEDDNAETEPAPPSDGADTPDDEELSDDQQAALDKIMAEINAKDDKADKDTNSEVEADAIEKNTPPQETHSGGSDTLSFDEFNDELDSLLSKAQQDTKKEAPTAESSTSASSKEMAPASEPQAEEISAAPATEMPALKYGPAPQPTQPSPTDTDPDADQEENSTDTPSAPAEKPRPAYAVLQEIDPDEGGKARPTRKARPIKPKAVRSGRLFKIASAVLVVLSIAGLLYWGLGRWNHQPVREPASASQPPVARSSADSSALEITTDLQPAPVTRPEPMEDTVEAAPQPVLTPLGSLKSDLAAAREQVAAKIEEITNLIAYYEEGIQEEHHKIQAALQNLPLPPLETALDNSQIELSIRAIQRRHAYISKLSSPLEQLKASSEELLFLERRTQLFETLSQWIGGPSMPQYKQEMADCIQIHMKTIKELSVDNTQTDLPSKVSVWNEVKARLEKERALAARRSKTNTRNKKIGQEICRGDYGRKYLLTHLSTEAATCLVQWSGKDLYLNGLTELSPQAARILAQWPGEWLSLNGIKELSAETAKCLSRWPGKRLSFNGLEKLSPQATAELSKWQGEQLEMIGLTAIGPWENYATRLYLSEAMRRKLQM